MANHCHFLDLVSSYDDSLRSVSTVAAGEHGRHKERFKEWKPLLLPFAFLRNDSRGCKQAILMCALLIIRTGLPSQWKGISIDKSILFSSFKSLFSRETFRKSQKFALFWKSITFYLKESIIVLKKCTRFLYNGGTLLRFSLKKRRPRLY